MHYFVQMMFDVAPKATVVVVENENDVMASGDLKRVNLAGWGKDVGDCICLDVND